MKIKLVLLILLTGIVHGMAQKKDITHEIISTITVNETKAHLGFLASDELRGRETGSREIDIAAQYIASYFGQIGLKPAPGADGYFQKVELQAVVPPSRIDLSVQDESFHLKDDLLLFSESEAAIDGEIVFAGYGTKQDMEKADVKGKIVVVLVGFPEENNLTKAFLSDSPSKARDAQTLGAAALIEIVAVPGVPFQALGNFLNQERMSIKKEMNGIPHLWMRNAESPALAVLKEKRTAKGSLNVSGNKTRRIDARNVAAIVEGTDPKLKSEYLVVSAHYDHVGVGRKNAEQDSIFNGARDNAIGTVGLMETAKFFVANPPKRSVLFLALTAEEKGLLGSAWYVEHPLVPLKQTVFNFNCDGAGYNDKTIATIIGLERTTAERELAKACEAFGLNAKQDPVPEQNLYERSDNYNFAVKGIPAIDFAPGVKAFDEELMKYYHQQADEVASLDFDYLIKYFRSYVYANYLLANLPKAPFWKPGDKFEEAGRKLYSAVNN